MDIDSILSSDNIAEDLDDETLNKISSDVYHWFEQDRKSRSGWEEINDSWLKLAMQVKEPKNTPWPNASNVKYPLLTTAAIQFASRSYPALVQGNSIVKVEPIGFDLNGIKADKARRISKHMSYQVLHEMEEWEESMDRLLFVLPIVGTGFKKSYFDAGKGRNVSEYVHPYDLIVNYYAKSMDSASTKTHVMSFYENEIVEMIRSGFYRDVSFGSSNKKVRDKLLNETQGINEPSDQSDGYDILECHCQLDLDDDGYKEPYIVTMLYNNKEVLRIVPRFSEDSISFNEKGEISRIVSDEYFTNYIFIPDPESGVYGLGFGALIGPLNEAVNTLINQLVDSGTLQTSSSGFISRGIKLGRGDVRFKPYEWKYTNTASEDLRKGILPLPVAPPSNVLFSLLGHLVDSGQKLSSTMDIMMGESPGQNQPATTTMAVLEQGLKVYTSIHKRVYRALKSEFKKLFKLNSKYLDNEQYFRVLDDPNITSDKVFRTDYDIGSMDVLPAADPNVVTQSQKLLKAEALVPLMERGLVNPQVVAMRLVEAQEQPNIEKLLQLPPPQPDPELVIKQAELQHRINYENKKLELDAQRVGSEALKDEFQALLSNVKAESLMRQDKLKDEEIEIEKRMEKSSDNSGDGKGAE